MTVNEQIAARATFKAFSESTKEDWDNISVQLKVTQSLVADRIIEQFEFLRHDFGGFPAIGILDTKRAPCVDLPPPLSWHRPTGHPASLLLI